MQYELTGRLCVHPCAGLEEPLVDTTVEVYRAEDEQEFLTAATASVKRTFGVRTEARSAELLGQDLTGEDGSFSVTFEAEEDLRKEAILIDAVVSDPLGRDVDPAEFTLTTLRPDWRQWKSGAIASWDYCLTPSQWCTIIEELERWMICGQVTVCDRDVTIPNATVRAFDADIIQTDALGSDVTDANGWYVIYYDRADFERVPAPFSPIELIGGADVFFQIADPGGTVMLDEDPSDGRQPGREDVDRCEHIDVCVPIDVDGDGPPIPTVWTQIGRAFTIPDGSSLNDFDDAGYAGSKKFALHRSIRMLGSSPNATSADNQVEYRFLVAPSTKTNTQSPMSASAFTRAVGDKNNHDLFASVDLGQLVRFTPTFDIITVEATLDSVDDDGWLNVQDAIDRAFTDAGITSPSVRSQYYWHDTDALLGVNTQALTSEPNVPDGTADAGEDVPSGDRIDIEQFAFRFEAREVNPSTGVTSPLRGHGQTLNRAVINNNRAFAEMEIVQQRGAKCDPLSLSDVDVGYTVYHPYLRDAEIQLKRNDAGWQDLHDPETSASVDSEVSFYSSTLSGADLLSMQDSHYNTAFDISGELTKKCTYILELRVRRRLHTGDDAANWHRHKIISFYAE